MLYPRIIPSLLIHKKGLVKTTKFKKKKYVGDPINAVKIFNEKEVDELIVLDIDASVCESEPDFKMIENIANECRMPLCYGGGVKTIEQALRIFNLGVEKIAISSLAVENPTIINELSKRVGSQSIVVVLDVKKKIFGDKYDLFIHNGTKKVKIDFVEFAVKMQDLGAGEIILNSIDNDGMMAGFNTSIIKKMTAVLKIPLTVLGGAGTMEDIGELIKENGIVGISAGSLFIFKGKYKAVLINYPVKLEKEQLFRKYFTPYWGK
jgi:imidazole glycerol-phosphate synthase subunit HisF